jgi:hypothetical protein
MTPLSEICPKSSFFFFAGVLPQESQKRATTTLRRQTLRRAFHRACCDAAFALLRHAEAGSSQTSFYLDMKFLPGNEVSTWVWSFYLGIKFLSWVWSFYLGMTFLPGYEVSTWVWSFYLGMKFLPGYEVSTWVWSFVPKYALLTKVDEEHQSSFTLGQNIHKIQAKIMYISWYNFFCPKTNFISACKFYIWRQNYKSGYKTSTISEKPGS